MAALIADGRIQSGKVWNIIISRIVAAVRPQIGGEKLPKKEAYFPSREWRYRNRPENDCFPEMING
ncbi:MAG: hypothetical protein OXC63_11500 [Aestuariivita sp.]|nr:hypothetical protein [Aestuariivita sp.]